MLEADPTFGACPLRTSRSDGLTPVAFEPVIVWLNGTLAPGLEALQTRGDRFGLGHRAGLEVADHAEDSGRESSPRLIPALARLR
jgi:hypothetical protein